MLGPSVAGVRQRHVGHALNRHVHRRVGERAPVGALEAHRRRDGAVELVADEDPVAHEVEGLARHALVVDADGGQAVLDGAVAGHVHDGGAVGERAQLVEGGERGPGVGRLVADGPVELGGVPDRLVDREPQVGRVDDEVVGAGLAPRARASFSASSSGSRASSASQSQFPADAGPVRYSQPRPTGGASVRIVSKPVVGERERLELGLQPHPVLGGPRPVEVGQVRLLGHRQQRRRRVRHGRVLAQPPAPLGQQRDLVGHRARVEGSTSNALDQATSPCDGLGRQLDAPAAGPAGHLGHLHGLADEGRPPPPAARRRRRRTRPRRRPRRARPCRSRCRPPSSRAGRRAGAPSGCGCARPAARRPGSPPRRSSAASASAERSSAASGIRSWAAGVAPPAGVGCRTGRPAAI